MCDSDRWPIPPFHPEDRWALQELLGPEEFERVVMGWVSPFGHPFPQDGPSAGTAKSTAFL